MESELRLDAFKRHLAQRARDTSAPALAHQCQGRAINVNEAALADALMEIFGRNIDDFTEVAAELTARSVVAPRGGNTQWSLELLTNELAEINADLDKSYEVYGYGA